MKANRRGRKAQGAKDDTAASATSAQVLDHAGMAALLLQQIGQLAASGSPQPPHRLTSSSATKTTPLISRIVQQQQQHQHQHSVLPHTDSFDDPRHQLMAPAPASSVQTKEFFNLGGGSEFSLNDYRQRCRERDELVYHNENLRTKLRQAEAEAARLNRRLETEEIERRKLEKKNADMGVQITEAKQSMRDTQAALQDVQMATEQRIQKTEQRDIQIQRLAAENSLLEARIYEVEAKCRDAENTFRIYSGDRDDTINRLQEQLSAAQDQTCSLQSDLTRARGEGMMSSTELEMCRRKLAAFEVKAKQSEQALELSHRSEMDQLENRLRLLSNKMDVYKTQEERLEAMQSDLRSRMGELQTMQESLHTSEGMRHSLEEQLGASETQIKLLEMSYTQLEARYQQRELEPAKKEAENELLRRQLRYLEETIQTMEAQSTYFMKVKQEYTNTIAVQSKSLESLVDAKVKLTRCQRENERLTTELSDTHIKLRDNERKNRLLSEDIIHAESYISELSSKFAVYGEKDAECRETILMANERISLLHQNAKELYMRLLADQQRVVVLEDQLHVATGGHFDSSLFVAQSPSEPLALAYAAPPTVPMPDYIERPSASLRASLASALRDTHLEYSQQGPYSEPKPLSRSPRAAPQSQHTREVNGRSSQYLSPLGFNDSLSSSQQAHSIELQVAMHFVASILAPHIYPEEEEEEEARFVSYDGEAGQSEGEREEMLEVMEDVQDTQEETQEEQEKQKVAAEAVFSQPEEEAHYVDLSPVKDPLIKCLHTVVRGTMDAAVINSALQSSLDGQYEELAVDCILRAVIVINLLSRKEDATEEEVSLFLAKIDPHLLLLLVDVFSQNPIFMSKAFYTLLTMCDFASSPATLPNAPEVFALIVKHPTDGVMISACFELLLAMVGRVLIDWTVLLELIDVFHLAENIVRGCFSVLEALVRDHHKVNALNVLELVYKFSDHEQIVQGIFSLLHCLADKQFIIPTTMLCDLIVKAASNNDELIPGQCITLLLKMADKKLTIRSENVLQLVEKTFAMPFSPEVLDVLRMMIIRHSPIRIDHFVTLLRFAGVYPKEPAYYSLLQALYDLSITLFKGDGRKDIEIDEIAEEFSRYGGFDVIIQHLDVCSNDDVVVLKVLRAMNHLGRSPALRARLGVERNAVIITGVMKVHNSNPRIMEAALILINTLCIDSHENHVQDNLRFGGVVNALVQSMVNNDEPAEKEFSMHCRCIISLCLYDCDANMYAFSEKVRSFCYLLRKVQNEPAMLEQLMLAIFAAIGHNKANHIRFLDGGICETLHDMLSEPESSSDIQLVCIWALSKIAMASDLETSETNDKIKYTLRKIVQHPERYSEAVKISSLALLKSKFYEDAVLTLSQENTLIAQEGNRFACAWIDTGMRNFEKSEEIRRAKLRALEEQRRKEAILQEQLLAEKQAREAKEIEEEQNRVRQEEIEARRVKIQTLAVAVAKAPTPRNIAALLCDEVVSRAVTRASRSPSPSRSVSPARKAAEASFEKITQAAVRGIISRSPSPQRSLSPQRGAAEAALNGILGAALQRMSSRSPSPIHRVNLSSSAAEVEERGRARARKNVATKSVEGFVGEGRLRALRKNE